MNRKAEVYTSFFQSNKGIITPLSPAYTPGNNIAYYSLTNLQKNNSKNVDEIQDELKTVKFKDKITIKNKFVWFKEIGGLDNSVFKALTQTKKELALSKILDCNIDYARDLLTHNSHKYSSNEKNGIKEIDVNNVKDQLR